MIRRHQRGHHLSAPMPTAPTKCKSITFVPARNIAFSFPYSMEPQPQPQPQRKSHALQLLAPPSTARPQSLSMALHVWDLSTVFSPSKAPAPQFTLYTRLRGRIGHRNLTGTRKASCNLIDEATKLLFNLNVSEQLTLIYLGHCYQSNVPSPWIPSPHSVLRAA